MKLTPLDIHHKEFHRSIRGYNEEEVDVFLDEVADEFERLFKENIDLQEQIEQVKQKMEQYQTIEATLQNTLFTAQKTAEELTSNARKESELILRDAELKAKDMIQQALAEKQRIQQIFLRIKQAEEEFRMKFKAMLDSYLQNVSEIPVPEDILLLTSPESDVSAAVILDQPVAAAAGEPTVAAAKAEEPAAKPEEAEAKEAEAKEADAGKPAGPEAQAPEVAKPAQPEAQAPEAKEAEEVAADATPKPTPEPEAKAPEAASRVAERPAAGAAPDAAPAPTKPEETEGEEPLLSGVATTASRDGTVKGLQLGEVQEKQLGDDIELPDFLKDPLPRTDEERARLKRHDSSVLADRDDDADIEEIS